MAISEPHEISFDFSIIFIPVGLLSAYLDVSALVLVGVSADIGSMPPMFGLTVDGRNPALFHKP